MKSKIKTKKRLDTIKIKNIWKIISILLAIVTLFLLYTLYSGNNPLASSSGEQAGKKLVDYLNSRGNGEVTYVSYKELGDIYEITVRFEDKEINTYTTRNGEYFIQGAVPINSQ